MARAATGLREGWRANPLMAAVLGRPAEPRGMDRTMPQQTGRQYNRRRCICLTEAVIPQLPMPETPPPQIARSDLAPPPRVRDISASAATTVPAAATENAVVMPILSHNHPNSTALGRANTLHTK